MKSEPKQEKEVINRIFVSTADISKELFCSICQEVFNDPVQSTCQHTFCRECITSWAKSKNHMTCPLCRVKINVKTLNRNLLAFQIINDLEIYCNNKTKGCEWIGALDNATSHLPNCQFSEGKLPDWFNTYMVAWKEEQDK